MDRRLAAILVADVVGYSRLMEADETGTLAALRERRKGIIEPLIREHSGRIVKFMGDGVLVEFASAVRAVQCALAVQQRMAEANAAIPESRRMVIRIGINLGDLVGEGSDIYGDVVNIAARLEALAEPAGICISGKVHEEVLGKLNFCFKDLGDQLVKNVSRPVRAYLLSHDKPEASALRLSNRPSLPEKPSIAVLPFQNMSGDPEHDYFADGTVEEIITALSRMRWLFVIARNSSFTYKGRSIDIKQVGRELGVRYVLEGSVRKSTNRIRIAGQLIDATTGVHLWADRFDGGVDDIFDLQDRVTASVVGAIAPKLEQAEIERARRKPTENLDAYDYFLRGMAQVHQYSREANAEALRLFYRALDLDPQFGSAYGLAARCYSQRKTGGWISDHAQAAAETERLARRAAELGKDDAIALCSAGIGLADVVGDLDAGAELVEKSIALNANLATVWLFSGWIRVSLGEPEVGIEHMSRAMRLSPQDPQVFSMQLGLAYAHFIASRYEEALSWAERAVRELPGFIFASCLAAASAALLGRSAQSEKFLALIRKLDPALSLATLNNLIVMRRPEDFERLAIGMRRAGLPE